MLSNEVGYRKRKQHVIYMFCTYEWKSEVITEKLNAYFIVIGEKEFAGEKDN